ncbi:MAG: S-layer homology domain-containing protein [Oscillibacter sp.]|nr:S-layer homology domain-containing protein [Oscillibacter sp.]
MKDWKCALTLTLALALTVCLGITARAAGDSPFEDVDSSAWYSADVTAVYQTGLFNGTSDTSFDPEGTLSLAQSAALAARLHQYAHSGAVTLQNGTDQWYSTYVDYAKQNGIISGEYDGRWSETATRAEMVKILYHALDADSYTAINTVEDNAIPDVKTGWAACDEIYAFYRAGILAGGEGNKFNSKSTIQRCEVAAILNRMLDPERRQSVTLTLPELPDPGDTNITAEKVFAILDRLDPDGAFILHSTATGTVRPFNYNINYNGTVYSDTGEAVDFLGWWSGPTVHWTDSGEHELGPMYLRDAMETAVHEEWPWIYTYELQSFG